MTRAHFLRAVFISRFLVATTSALFCFASFAFGQEPSANDTAGKLPPLAKVDEAALQRIRELRARIVESTKTDTTPAAKDYSAKIPRTGVPYDMVAIDGGEFLMGSPASEPGRSVDEGPQVRVRVKPFWMGKYEVTWDLYEPFMMNPLARNKDGTLKYPEKEEHLDSVDQVSMPTTPYMSMDFGMGKAGYPAICMTHHAANKFCEWLSFQTGHYYRLPTETEWEYACRAGTTTAYSFGDDPAKLADYAVFDPEQIRTGYEKVGTKKPNPWGLYDMHGNVLEWCLDQYSDQTYQRWKAGGEPVESPFVPAVKRYPRVARGGSWYDLAELCRSAARTLSDPAWQQGDAQLPKSLWYLTDAAWLGFRLLRPVEIPSAEEMYFLWNSGGVEQ